MVNGLHVNNREVGTPGDKATRDYIAKQLVEAGLEVTRQSFTFDYFREITPAILERTSPLTTPPPLVYAEGEPNSPNDFHIAEFSGNGDVTAPIQAVGVVIPPGALPNSDSSGCDPGDFANFQSGNIALLQRGTCGYRVKVDNAFAAGAAGVILFNEGQTDKPGGNDRFGLVGATLGGPGVTIPVVFARFTVGEDLYNLSRQGPVSVHLVTNAELIPTTTENIFGETRQGNRDQVVMVGAHLDSVPDGPGINDNGSGIGTLLALARGMKEKDIDPLNAVRFAFWGAEEPGQEGSDFYVEGLSAADKAKIALYVNVDMTGSPNFVPSVYDSDGSTEGPVFFNPPPATGGPRAAQVEQVFVDYFSAVTGAAPKLLGIDRRSDYAAFLAADIPFAAVTSGFDKDKKPEEAAAFGGTAGAPYDPCYHKACDTIDNVSNQSLDLMGGAVVHAILNFASRPVIFP